MTYCCSQCDFTTQFESALTMHHQLHHEDANQLANTTNLQKIISEKANTLPISLRKSSPTRSIFYNKLGMGSKSSATRLFGKIRERICRGKGVLMSTQNEEDALDITANSECTSKAMKYDSLTVVEPVTSEVRESYGCHLCDFVADRITVLDRHLLNVHKLSLENLLQLVLAKTRAGLSDEVPTPLLFGRRPYYRPVDNTVSNGEYVVETVTPKIKIMKHTATNTELTWHDIPDLKDNCQMISRELLEVMKTPMRFEQNELLSKMASLNECMCKFVSSSNTLKNVLSRDEHKWQKSNDMLFELRLDGPPAPREWERAHSEKVERARSKHSDKYRSEKLKLNSESYYF